MRASGAWAFALSAALLFPAATYADGPTIYGKILVPDVTYAAQEIDISQQLATMQFMMSRVVLVDPRSAYRFALDESGLRSVGCSYVGGADDIVKILISSHIHTLPRPNSSQAYFRSPDLRTGVYLQLKDGSWIKLLFGKDYYGHDQIQGKYDDGQFDPHYAISADASLVRRLYEAAARVQTPDFRPTAPNAQACQQLLKHFTAKPS